MVAQKRKIKYHRSDRIVIRTKKKMTRTDPKILQQKDWH
jgi:hypothetical protein